MAATPKRSSGPLRTVDNTLSPHSAADPSPVDGGLVTRRGVRYAESANAGDNPVSTDVGTQVRRGVRSRQETDQVV